MINRKNTKICIELTKNILQYSKIVTTHTRAKLFKQFFDKLCTLIRKQNVLYNKIRFCLKKLKTNNVLFAKVLLNIIENSSKTSGFISNKSIYIRQGDCTKMDVLSLKR